MNIYSYEFIEFIYNVNSIFYTRFYSLHVSNNLKHTSRQVFAKMKMNKI